MNGGLDSVPPNRWLRRAATVFGAGLLLGPPIGALLFATYRAVLTSLPWGPDALQGERALIFVYLAYVFAELMERRCYCVRATSACRHGGASATDNRGVFGRPGMHQRSRSSASCGLVIAARAMSYCWVKSPSSELGLRALRGHNDEWKDRGPR